MSDRQKCVRLKPIGIDLAYLCEQKTRMTIFGTADQSLLTKNIHNYAMSKNQGTNPFIT